MKINAQSLPLTLLLNALLMAPLSSCSSTPSTKPPTEANSADDDEDTKARISPDTPEMELIADATSAYDRGLFSLSREAWAALRDGHPGSAFLPLAELKISDTYFYTGTYPEAITAYEEFIRLHPGHAAVPYARYQIGNAYFKQYSDMKRDQAPLLSAIKAYTQLLEKHPQCDYSPLAKRQITQSRELLAEYEAAVAEFYIEQELMGSAANRYRALIENYGDTAAAKQLGPAIHSALEEVGTSATAELNSPVPPAITNQNVPQKPDLVGGFSGPHNSENLRQARASFKLHPLLPQSHDHTETADHTQSAP